MLRRILSALLTAVLLLLPSGALAKEEPAYEALAGVLFNIRREPDSNHRIKQVPKAAEVLIYEYGEEWCRVGYDGEIGWCRTEWLWRIHSLDAVNHPLPGVMDMAGFVTLKENTLITGGEFKGITADAGALICVTPQSDSAYPTPVWRGMMQLPTDAGELTPFVPWELAQPGHVIAGYTTFFNEEGRGEKGDNRVFNIKEGCVRTDGTVVRSGEAFSFNALCGPYLKKNGYLLARNIGNDGVGYGGGICQVTTTLYNAVIQLPLQIDEWAVHRRSGVDYVPQYFDAAVGAYSDFTFTNMLPYDIVINSHMSNGVVTVLISRTAE